MERATFSWMTSLLYCGSHATLQEEHVYDCLPEDSVDATLDRLSDAWCRQVSKGRRTGALACAMYSIWWPQFWLAGCFHFIELACLLNSPLMLNLLLRFFADPHGSNAVGVATSLGLIAGQICNVFGQAQFVFLMTRLGVQARGATVAMVFAKAMRLSEAATKQYNAGRIVSIVQVDCSRFVYSSYFCQFLWSMPLLLVASMCAVWSQLKLASLVAIAVMVLLTPVNLGVMRKMMKLHRRTSKARDKRVAAFTEVNRAVSLTKLLAWEENIFSLVMSKRTVEMRHIATRKMYELVNALMWVVIPMWLPIIAFGAFVLISVSQGTTLDPATAFTTISLLGVLSIPMNLMPQTVQFLSAMYISMCRIEAMLLGEEREQEYGEFDEPGPGVWRLGHRVGADAIRIEQGAVRWTPEPRVPSQAGSRNPDDSEEEQEDSACAQLRQIIRARSRGATTPVDVEAGNLPTEVPMTLTLPQVSIPQGALTIVVGKVGSGKSTLLSTILSEVPLLQG